MATKFFTTPRSLLLLFLGITLTVFIGEYLLVQSMVFAQNGDALSLAITADIAIGIPVLYYFLMVRKGKAPWTSALVVYLVMVGAASFLLPDTHHKYVNWLEMSLIISEGTLVGFIILKIRKLIRQYKVERSNHPDFVVNLRNTFEKVMGNAIPFVIGEIATIRYALFWKAPIEAFEQHKAFTIHKKSGAVAIFGAFVMATIAEATAVHLLLYKYNETLAIVLLILSIYSLLYLVGFAVSLTKRPILIDGNTIYIRIGMFWTVSFNKEQIEKVELIKRIDENDKTILNVASAIMTSPNLLIHFKEEITVTGLYGIKKNTQKMSLFVDKKDEFLEVITS